MYICEHQNKTEQILLLISQAKDTAIIICLHDQLRKTHKLDKIVITSNLVVLYKYYIN